MGWLDIAQSLEMAAGYTTPIRRWSDPQQQARGPTPQPDAEFYKTLSKALDEIAAGLELVSKAD